MEIHVNYYMSVHIIVSNMDELSCQFVSDL